MGGFGGGSSGGKEGPRNEQKKAKKSNPVKDFITSGGVTGMVVRAFKNIGTKNKTVKSGDTYAGKAYGYNELAEKSNYSGSRGFNNLGGDNDNQKSIEQPKVASQLNNSKIKSDKIIADKISPTTIEMTDDERMMKAKRRGRRTTVLTSVTGVESKPKLSKKTLLG